MEKYDEIEKLSAAVHVLYIYEIATQREVKRMQQRLLKHIDGRRADWDFHVHEGE